VVLNSVVVWGKKEGASVEARKKVEIGKCKGSAQKGRTGWATRSTGRGKKQRTAGQTALPSGR